mmetsp:Transcript_91663/g.264369  ORF Transcript_91663/g.264369 Transcript_91663/m.264369 type:complete len:298 (-) Transcript_91663:130-1023(-)
MARRCAVSRRQAADPLFRRGPRGLRRQIALCLPGAPQSAIASPAQFLRRQHAHRRHPVLGYRPGGPHPRVGEKLQVVEGRLNGACCERARARGELGFCAHDEQDRLHARSGGSRPCSRGPGPSEQRHRKGQRGGHLQWRQHLRLGGRGRELVRPSSPMVRIVAAAGVRFHTDLLLVLLRVSADQARGREHALRSVCRVLVAAEHVPVRDALREYLEGGAVPAVSAYAHRSDVQGCARHMGFQHHTDHPAELQGCWQGLVFDPRDEPRHVRRGQGEEVAIHDPPHDGGHSSLLCPRLR